MLLLWLCFECYDSSCGTLMKSETLTTHIQYPQQQQQMRTSKQDRCTWQKLWDCKRPQPFKLLFNEREVFFFFNFLILQVFVFPVQGQISREGVTSQPATDGVWEGEFVCGCGWNLIFKHWCLLFCIWLTLLFFSGLLTDLARGPNNHRQPRDQGTNGRVTSGRG